MPPLPSPFDLPPWLYVLTTLGGAVVVMSWRFRETRKPVTLPSIIAPPLGMSTGLFMFFAPQTRIPPSWGLAALVLGATLFAWPLMRSSKLAVVEGQVVMQRSRAFVAILLGLLAVRFALRAYIEQTVSTPQTGALFFLLALGAIARWRITMLFEFNRLKQQLASSQPVSAPASARP